MTSPPRHLRETQLRLYTPTGDKPTPFLKWVGGKTQLLPRLAPFFPSHIPACAEPFLGGGAVFFFLRGRGWLTGRVVLPDINAELVNACVTVRDCVEELTAPLAAHKAAHDAAYFYAVRRLPFTPDVGGAARTIYLNKTCFNGLYRVNRPG